nr:hypothetical protein [Pseudomonadota bacterium]MDQ3445327.1 hypothetical protein [Pseudomonadota bacterium]
MTNISRLKTCAAAFAVVLLTVSCGSSSDDSAPPPTTQAQEDAAASGSVAGFIAFIQTLIASMTLDTNEPRDVGGITPPVTETAEPTTI